LHYWNGTFSLHIRHFKHQPQALANPFNYLIIQNINPLSKITQRHKLPRQIKKTKITPENQTFFD